MRLCVPRAWLVCCAAHLVVLMHGCGGPRDEHTGSEPPRAVEVDAGPGFVPVQDAGREAAPGDAGTTPLVQQQLESAPDAGPHVTAPCPGSEGWIWPVAGPVTSPFGMRDGELHDALDIGARMGSEVVAPADMRILTIAYQRRAGRYIAARMRGARGRFDGPRVTFAHLSHTAVFEGDVVAKGERIGLIGLSGSASGPHLHLRVQVPTVDGQPELETIDPLRCLPAPEPAPPSDAGLPGAP